MSNSNPVDRLKQLDSGYLAAREDREKRVLISGMLVDENRNELYLADMYNRRVKRANLLKEPFSVASYYTIESNQFLAGLCRLKLDKQESGGSGAVAALALLELSVENDPVDGFVYIYEITIVCEYPDGSVSSVGKISMPEVFDLDRSGIERHLRHIIQARDGNLLVLVTHVSPPDAASRARARELHAAEAKSSPAKSPSKSKLGPASATGSSAKVAPTPHLSNPIVTPKVGKTPKASPVKASPSKAANPSQELQGQSEMGSAQAEKEDEDEDSALEEDAQESGPITRIWEVAKQMHSSTAFAKSASSPKRKPGTQGRGLTLEGEALAMTYDPHANLIALAMKDRTIRLLERLSFKEVRRIERDPASFIPHSIVFNTRYRVLLVTNSSTSAPVAQQQGVTDLTGAGAPAQGQSGPEGPAPSPLPPASHNCTVFTLEAFDLQGNNVFRGGDLKVAQAGGAQYSALALAGNEEQLIVFDAKASALSFYLLQVRRVVHLSK